VKEGERHAFGPFDCEFVAVNHSIPDGLAVAIRTGAGMVLHTGDFKMDQFPLDDRITDLRAFARLGEEGVDLFLTDSTNAEVPGFTTSERELNPAIEQVMRTAPRRVIVSSFASHVHRIQQVLDAAHQYGRKVAFVGRSMVRNMGIARELGYLKVPAGLIVSTQELEKLPDHQVTLVCTGSQGEPMAALSRMANRDHMIRIGEGDTVLLASSLIPGNENAIYRLINGLTRWGANVVHKGNAKVHVSGHASAGELVYCTTSSGRGTSCPCTARGSTCGPTPIWRSVPESIPTGSSSPRTVWSSTWSTAGRPSSARCPQAMCTSTA
jgi:ribonuclease J